MADFNITPASKGYLRQMSGWTRFLYVMNVIGVVFMAILGVVCFFVPEIAGDNEALPGYLLGCLYLITAGVMVPPAVFLSRAAKASKSAAADEDSLQLEEALKNYKSLFKFYGIYIIAAILLTILLIIGGIILGIMAL